MTMRVLEPSEWPRLAGTEAETVWPLLDPENARVVVVENHEGQIVGTWTVLRLVHVECCWIAPEYRGSFGVSKRLLRGMRAVASQWGAKAVMTAALTDQVRALITSLGGSKLPGEHFVMPVEGR